MSAITDLTPNSYSDAEVSGLFPMKRTGAWMTALRRYPHRLVMAAAGPAVSRHTGSTTGRRRFGGRRRGELRRGNIAALSDDNASFMGIGQFSQRPGAAPQQGNLRHENP